MKSLSDLGVSITLHCYEYGRERPAILEELCSRVYFYKRSTGIQHIASKKPYIVKSRNSSELLNNLLKDRAPILFEGLHSTYFLDHKDLKNRKKLVRTHNIEHEYYDSLQIAEKGKLKQFYFDEEAKKLRKYEKILQIADHVLTISINDQKYFNKKYKNSIYIPAFHPNQKVDINPEQGNYVLYHGNLAVAENISAVLELITNVFGKIKYQVVVAGRDPDKRVVKAISEFKNIELISNPTDTHMSKLISNAQVNVLTTNQNTGIKLKLIASLFRGKYCIVNTPMVENTGLEELCIIKNDYSEMIKVIYDLFNKVFYAEEIEKRKITLEESYLNKNNAIKILNLI